MFQKNNIMRGFLQGSVISQDPEAGAEVEKGTKITVIISKGPEELPPKEVPVEVAIPYDPLLKVHRKSYVSQMGDMNNDISDTSL